MAKDVVLDNVNPKLIDLVFKLKERMLKLGYPMFVCQGFRTAEYQAGLYASGRTKSGKILTNCDGIIKKSPHQSGNAVDLAFDTATPFADNNPWDLFGVEVKKLGCIWGGDFHIHDLDHMELKNGTV